jgi:hypothetical protein
MRVVIIGQGTCRNIIDYSWRKKSGQVGSFKFSGVGTFLALGIHSLK